MHRRIFLLLALVVCVRPVFAGDSVISLDDTRAYLISRTLPRLMEVDLEKKTYRPIDLSSSFKEPVVAVALSNTGFVLCATQKAVWSYDPKNAKCIKVCNAPKGAWDKPQEIDDISYDPRTGTIVVHSGSLYCRPSKEDRWYSVHDRYNTDPYRPTFSADGALFCVSMGDLWVGFLNWEDDDTENPSKPDKRAFFEGYRCLPLTITPVGNFNSWWVGFHQIAVTQHAIYGDYSRMGGSSIAALIRVKRPASLTLSVTKNKHGEENANIGSGSGDGPGQRAAFWQELQTMINSVEELPRPDRDRECVEKQCNSLCASRDGRLVLYTDYDDHGDTDLSEVYLIKDDKKPETVKLRALAQ